MDCISGKVPSLSAKPSLSLTLKHAREQTCGAGWDLAYYVADRRWQSQLAGFPIWEESQTYQTCDTGMAWQPAWAALHTGDNSVGRQWNDAISRWTSSHDRTVLRNAPESTGSWLNHQGQGLQNMSSGTGHQLPLHSALHKDARWRRALASAAPSCRRGHFSLTCTQFLIGYKQPCWATEMRQEGTAQLYGVPFMWYLCQRWLPSRCGNLEIWNCLVVTAGFLKAEHKR